MLCAVPSFSLLRPPLAASVTSSELPKPAPQAGGARAPTGTAPLPPAARSSVSPLQLYCAPVDAPLPPTLEGKALEAAGVA